MVYTIRWATHSDLPALQNFFERAYGKESAFRDAGFLRWFLEDPSSGDLNAVVALADGAEIVAHYGALAATLTLGSNRVPLLWGVNAYTLPDHRGHGLGQALLPPFLERKGVFGVRGFRPRVRDYYARLGFNVFGGVRAHFHLLSLDGRCLEIFERFLKTPDPFPEESGEKERDEATASRAVQLLRPNRPDWLRSAEEPNAIEMSKADLARFRPGPAPGVKAYTDRCSAYLIRRFLENPYLQYAMWGWGDRNAISAYAVTRRLLLKPTAFYATRIVDVFGDPEAVARLIRRIGVTANDRGDSYVQFCCFGPRYDEVFRSLGFVELREAEAELLPLVTSPIERRSNHEYLGLYSASFTDEISRLTSDQVFFTRADSDRDRVGRIDDIPAALRKGA